MTKGGWVYILANRREGTPYTGVTSDLPRRLDQHRTGQVGFTRRYRVYRLVYAEPHDDIRTAIQRETSIKRWPRQWNINLIVSINPGWYDLSLHGL